VIGATLTAALLASATPAAQVVFLPEVPGPTLILQVFVAEQNHEVRTRRAALIVLDDKTGTLRRFEDTPSGLPVDDALHRAIPAPLAVDAAFGDGLIVTLPDLGDWQTPAVGTMSARERALGPPVASPTAARLVLTKGRGALVTGEGRAEGRASLYGTQALVRGQALLVTGPITGAIALDARNELTTVATGGFVVDVVRACEQTMPRRIVGPQEDTGRLRLQLQSPVCLEGGGLVARLVGERRGRRGPAALRGIWLP
jgi:hypothetical protein